MEKITEAFQKIVNDEKFITIRDKFFVDVDKIITDFKEKTNKEVKKD